MEMLARMARKVIGEKNPAEEKMVAEKTTKEMIAIASVGSAQKRLFFILSLDMNLRNLTG